MGNNIVATLVCALSLAWPAAVWSQHAHDEHDAHGAAKPAPAAAPVPAVRWATDPPLRQGIARLHVVLEQIARYEMGQASQQSALERADDVEEIANHIFKNCKLEPEADAVLHGMLVPMLAALQAFRENPEDFSQIEAMRMAIAHYPHYFDDPGFPRPGDVIKR